MEVLILLVGLGLLATVVLVPVAVFLRLHSLRTRLDGLEWQVQRLSDLLREQRLGSGAIDNALEAKTAPVAPPAAPPATAPAIAPDGASAPASPPATAIAGAPPGAASAPPLPPAAMRPPAATAASPRASVPSQPAPAALDAAGLEQLIGGVWLQNLGAVLLLVGVFLMILWGYTTGRFGPQVLVAAGVATGLGFVWRGDRVARRVAPFGHALIGIGLGIVYLTLHMGYVRLHVLPAWLAFGLLVLVSVGSMLAGLHYRVPLIATLGVIGAFLPQFLGSWLGLSGFQLPPPALLGYLAAIDLLVFALAARAGWSGLNLAAVILSALAWAAAYPDARWGWGTQIGLSALFGLLGVAPLPRLVGAEGRVRGIDLAVVAVAPLAMVFASFPFLAHASRVSVAMLLLSLAALHLVAALWVDSRRPERDLWAPLTGAATLFLTAAIERLLGREYTALAWGVEGLLLLALGLRAGGGWLRMWGTLVTAVGAMVTIARLVGREWDLADSPVLHAASLRALAAVVVLLVGAHLLERGRRHLAEVERALPGLWLAMGHALLFVWGFAEAGHVADGFATVRPTGLEPVTWTATPAAVHGALTAFAWSAQAAWLLLEGARMQQGLRRAAGHSIGALAAVALLVTFALDKVWPPGNPVFHLTGTVTLLSIAVIATTSAVLARRRGSLTPAEEHAPELGAFVVVAMLAVWGLREAGHLAHAMAMVQPVGVGGAPRLDETRFRALSAAFANGAWLVEASGLLVIGWLRGSAVLRWCALGLLALTLLRFVIVDLQTVDIFWRFLTAIAVGAAMLAMSYVYQRRVRERAAER